MAISIVWSLIFATGLTLFLVSSVFAISDDLVGGAGPGLKFRLK